MSSQEATTLLSSFFIIMIIGIVTASVFIAIIVSIIQHHVRRRKERENLIKFQQELHRQQEEYIHDSYYEITKIPYQTLLHDNTSTGRGRYGEYLTYTYLKSFEANGGKFLFNLYIPKGHDQTTEIDILLICSKGIFCFESKNYSGWIFGSEYQKNWCQTLPQWNRRSHKEYFNNPVIQNKTHIKYLKNLIGRHFPIHSVIVFSERCVLKDIQIKSNDIHVVNRYNVASTVSEICRQIPDEPLNEAAINELYQKLYPYTQLSETEKQQHVDSIKENHKETPDLKCPVCGGKMLLRTAQKGQYTGNQFYGCSNYPKCRYIQNI